MLFNVTSGQREVRREKGGEGGRGRGNDEMERDGTSKRARGFKQVRKFKRD